MVIVIVIDFLVFVFSDTHKNESQEYQFNGENSTARYGYAFILSYTLKKKILTKALISKQMIDFSTNSSIPKINKNEITQIIYFLLIIVVSFVMIFYSSKFLIQLGDLIPYFILIYFFISLIQKFDSRIPIAFALFLLFLTAIILVQGQEKAANQIAIYAYYFLVIGVVQQLIEYIRNPQEA